MGEIAPALWKKIEGLCQSCDDVFGSQSALHQFFGRDLLYAWQEYLPQAGEKNQCIDVTLKYLWGKKNVWGENALVLFLQALDHHYGTQDKRHPAFQQAIRGLQATLKGPLNERTYDTQSRPLQRARVFAMHEFEAFPIKALSVAFLNVLRFSQGQAVSEESGTGWLIAPDLLLTCLHVVTAQDKFDDPFPDERDLELQWKNMAIYFDWSKDSGSGIEYGVQDLAFRSIPEQDFAILRVKDREYHPLERFGYLSIELDAHLTQQTGLFIIQHPWGKPKQIALGGSFMAETELHGRICYTCDTQWGTSGAPVLRHQSGHAVAIHNGKIFNEDAHSVYSEGTQLAAILAILKTQAPKLYREIMDFQGKLNSVFRQHEPQREPQNIISAQQCQFQAAHAPATAPLREREEERQASPVPKSLLYSFLGDYSSSTPILSLTFDPTGKEILYGTQAENIYRIEATTLRPLSVLKTFRAVTSLAFHRDGTYLASGTDDGELILWQRTELEFIRYKSLQAHGDWITEVVFSADGRHLVSGSDDGSLCILEIGPRHARTERKPQGIRTLACHPQQDLWASCAPSQNPEVWRIASQQDTDVPALTGTFLCLRFSPDGGYLVGGKAEGHIVIYDTRTWKPTVLLERASKAIRCFAFHPQEPLLASGGDDDKIQLWNILTGQHVQTLPCHVGRVTGLCFSPNGGLLAIAGRDGKLVIWQVK